MAQNSWPSPNHNSRNVTEAELEKITARFSDDGLYGSPADPAPVVAGTGLQVLVKKDLYGSLRGFTWASGSTDVPLTIAANASGLPRTDRVVLQLDRATWDVRAVVLTGTPGAGPPALTRTEFDTGKWEELLAEVPVPNGAAAVTVTPRPVYVGTRVRAANSGKRRANPGLGEINFEPDTGRWTGYNGTTDTVLHQDTDYVTYTLNGPQATHWTKSSDCFIRKINNVVHLRMTVRRWNTNGLDTAAESTPLILAQQFRPPFRMLGSGFQSRSPVALFVESSGAVTILPLTADIPAGRTVYTAATWMVG
ncbi:hypothetical protein [Actinomadura sp. 3N508]|uniref:hypothetical protein n=1 Tax=Actinomadura sp. 3N508 TaxID=3375153 RepID=UPI0037BD4771